MLPVEHGFAIYEVKVGKLSDFDQRRPRLGAATQKPNAASLPVADLSKADRDHPQRLFPAYLVRKAAFLALPKMLRRSPAARTPDPFATGAGDGRNRSATPRYAAKR
jgi:hypothetical protein